MKNNQLAKTVILTLLSTGVAMATTTTMTTSNTGTHVGNTEKCYGVAKAGKNGCGTAQHSCANQATTDNSPQEWVMVTKGTCQQAGGSLTPDGITNPSTTTIPTMGTSNLTTTQTGN